MSTNEQVDFIKEPIDEKLFVPLSRYFLENKPDFQEFKEFILAKGGGRNYGCGFLLDCYVKWTLDKFRETTGSFLHPSKFSQGRIKDNLYFFTTNFGNVEFQKISKKGKKQAVTEIDGLYEYLQEEDSKPVTPIIFEITGEAYDRFLNARFKMGLVSSLYSSSPYLCKIKIKKDERLGLHIARIENHLRAIIIPDIDLAGKLLKTEA